MKKFRLLVVLFILVSALSVVFVPVAGAAPNDRACWGQATKVFAQTGAMGQHASEFSTPRAGLRNLARDLYGMGVLPNDTMQALGAFVATELGLSIDACMD